MKIGCSEVPKPTYLSFLGLAEWKKPAPLGPHWKQCIFGSPGNIKNKDSNWITYRLLRTSLALCSKRPQVLQRWEQSAERKPDFECWRGLRWAPCSLASIWVVHSLIRFSTLGSNIGNFWMECSLFRGWEGKLKSNIAIPVWTRWTPKHSPY